MSEATENNLSLLELRGLSVTVTTRNTFWLLKNKHNRSHACHATISQSCYSAVTSISKSRISPQSNLTRISIRTQANAACSPSHSNFATHFNSTSFSVSLPVDSHFPFASLQQQPPSITSTHVRPRLGIRHGDRFCSSCRRCRSISRKASRLI